MNSHRLMSRGPAPSLEITDRQFRTSTLERLDNEGQGRFSEALAMIIRVGLAGCRRLPLYPYKQTSLWDVDVSQTGQKLTSDLEIDGRLSFEFLI